MDAIERMEHYATIAGDGVSTAKVAIIQLTQALERMQVSGDRIMPAEKLVEWSIKDLTRFVLDSDTRVDTMRKEEAA